MNRRLAGLAMAMGVFAADQASKYWILNGLRLPDRGMVEILPVLNFVMVWNHGITFGMFSNPSLLAGTILALIALAVVAGLIAWLWRVERLTTTLAIGAITGGATGNVLDRVRHGAVVDFIEAHIGPYSWYVFNVADAAIVCGVGVLLLESLFQRDAPALSKQGTGDKEAP